MDSDSAVDLSLSASSSLCDILPDLRKPEARLTRGRARAGSMSSDLSSLIDSDLSSDLSDISDSEDEKPRKRQRQTKQHSPEPLSDSESSGDEETSTGKLKPGKKQYLKAGFYSSSFKDRLADSPFTVDIPARASLLSAVPLALPHSAPEEVVTSAEGAECTGVEEKRQARAASSIANQKFTRNGAGKPLPSVTIQQKAPKKKQVKPATTYVPGSLLPLPINFGEALFEQERDFKLAFDIVRDYSQGSIGRQRVFERAGHSKRPTKYMTLKQNMFVERNKFPAEIPAICQCKKGSKCGEDCINRLMLYLCSPKLCPAGSSCTNTPLSVRKALLDSRGREAAVPFWTGNRGFGLKTRIDIEAGQYIMEYRGEIISRDESYRRVLHEYKDRHDFYFLDYDGEEVVDAGMKGNAARFANHSCGPNCKMIRFRLADCDEWQIGLFAQKDIKAGSELTYNYGWVNFASLADDNEEHEQDGDVEMTDTLVPVPTKAKEAMQRCYCGAAACSGYLGAKKKAEKTKLKPKAKSNAAQQQKKRQIGEKSKR